MPFLDKAQALFIAKTQNIDEEVMKTITLEALTPPSEAAKERNKKALELLRKVEGNVNGGGTQMTTEKSPEQNVREFYEAFAESDDQFDQGVSYGIMRTLEMLGIKLEGVNA